MKRLKARHVGIVAALLWISLGATTAFGQLLVSDAASNEVLEFSLGGSYEKQLIGPANPSSNSNNNLNFPSAMAFGDGTDLFVASQNAGEVLRYNGQTGQYLGVFASGLNAPGGLLFDSANNTLYVSEFGQYNGSTIDRFNATTGASLGSIGSGSALMGGAGMAIGPDGLLYVSSFSNGSVLRFNPTTGAPAGIVPGDPSATFASGPLTFGGTNSLVFDKTGKLDAVGLFTFDVYQFGSNGAQLGDLIPYGGGLVYPCSMLIAPNGDLFVSSLGNNNSSDPSAPLEPGYISEYNINTGAAIDLSFITTSSIDGRSALLPTAMLLTPTPEPSTFAMALIGALPCLAWCVRRRRLGQ